MNNPLNNHINIKKKGKKCNGSDPNAKNTTYKITLFHSHRISYNYTHDK